MLKTNVTVQRISKRELKVVDKFRTKLWLEKLKEAASTHKHLKALIEDTHVRYFQRIDDESRQGEYFAERQLFL